MKPIIIFELSQNYRRPSLCVWENCEKLLYEARMCGAKIIKLQLYDPEAFSEGSLTQVYRDLSLPREFIPKIFDFCVDHGIELITSVFSLNDVSEAESFGCFSGYKISAFEANKTSLIKAVISTRKPLYITANFCNIDKLVSLIPRETPLVLFKCTSDYPALHDNLNLVTLLDMKKRLSSMWALGLSDHTTDSIAMSVALTMMRDEPVFYIEKHFRGTNCLAPEADFAMSLAGMQIFIKDIYATILSWGHVSYNDGDEKYRCRRVATRLINKGEPIDDKNTDKKRILKDG